MEALWNLEEKWKLTTQEALFIFVCTAFGLIVLCAATILKEKAKRKQIMDRDPGMSGSIGTKWCEPSCNWVSIKRVLMGSLRWSRAKRWEEEEGSVGDWRERQPPLLGMEGREGNVEWQSHNSASPVWQRPILMGEKCELPRFSGLILYDERGRLLDHSLKGTSLEDNVHQENPAAVVRTTLKDLLSRQEHSFSN